MARWRSSLALLSSLESQPLSHRSVKLPDFLAPALVHSSTPTFRRHNASIARADFEEPAFDSSARSAGSSLSAASRRTGKTKPRRPLTQHTRVGFSSYFDPDLPDRSSPTNCSAVSTSSFIDAETAYIEARLSAADDEAQIVAVAKQLLYSPALKAERWWVNSSASRHEQNASDPPLVLHEHYLVSLLKSAFAATRRSGKNDVAAMDALTAGRLRRISVLVPCDALRARFLAKLTLKASSKAATGVLEEILRILERQMIASLPRSISRAETVASLSQLILLLMQAFSHAGKLDRVRACFDVLHEHSLPPTVFHYQFQLIALLREQASQPPSRDLANFGTQSRQIQADILQIKASMDANGIPIDESFLATIVSGLSAPLRSPRSTHTSAQHALEVLQLVRTVFKQFTGLGEGKSFHELPRVASALIKAEIDALRPAQRSGSAAFTTLLNRIHTLIAQLYSGSMKRTKCRSEAQLAAMTLRLRLLSTVGDFPAALALLKRIFRLQPNPHPQAGMLNNDLILKQRSSVIHIFSTALQQRATIEGQDSAYEVLKLAFSSEWFDKVWSGVIIPSNPEAGYDKKAFDGEATVLRLWRRWIRAWDSDVLAQGSWQAVKEEEEEEKKLERYETFVGRYRWQTLKRGLILLNDTLDQLEARPVLSSISPAAAAAAAGDEEASPSQSKFGLLFCDPAQLDIIVKITLRGGRLPGDETMSTHVDRRLSLMIRTLTRTRVPARIWKLVESSMLRHLALIDRTILPTESVRRAMDEIDLHKRRALLRNKPLMEAVRDAQQQQTGASDGEEEEYALETGSVFVLRQILNQRAAQKKASAAAAAAAAAEYRPLFA
ncbi:uncharacterized protein UDID_06502 [Ustilago sp. UG-2017a]|nr:uncharacterized protein UDID_06502 [Ustilago sp. UG-2017a]